MSETVEPLYLYLVKNLKGIVYFSGERSPESELDWLKRHFRYRALGISETLGLTVKWKNLIILPKIVENPVLDSLFQASRLLCPLLILKEGSLKDFGSAVVATLRTKQHLSDKDLKFNIRLMNYAITDFYLKTIDLALKGDLDGRKQIAEKDLKRFWRIKPDADGNPIIAYLDPILIERHVENPVFMSLVPAIVLDFQHSC
ncbi:hypothetical protein H5T51_07625 [Candidatus Bathyarchaeota archaeon]|nr:hypothetical protein [Candidatus Bathyarchaeota archaeon]